MLRIAVVAALSLASGATVTPLTRADLAARADTVVRARIVSSGPVRSERSGRILTRSRLSVLETFKGEPRPERELEQMGGTLDGATLKVPGDAKLEQGEEVVLYLRCVGKERCHLFGLALGKFGIRAGADGRKWAVRELSGLSNPQGTRLDSDTIPLESLERELRRKP